MAESNYLVERDDYASLCNEVKERISKINKSFGGESQGDKSLHIFQFDQVLYKDRFTPQVVSIGPYYNGNPNLKAKEDFKWQCLAYSLEKSQKNSEDYFKKIWALDLFHKFNPESYDLRVDELLLMMVLDGCFIVELIRFSNSIRREEKPKQSDMKSHHPLARMERADLPKICADLLMLQNQIPYKFLEEVFEVSKLEGETQNLFTLSAEFFSAMLGFHYSPFKNFPRVEHLLDLVRSTFGHPGIPSNFGEGSPSAKDMLDGRQMPLRYRYKPLLTIHSVTKLRRVGIKVRPRREGGLVVNFHHGVIEMPKIILNDLTCSFLEICVTLEQRHNFRPKCFSAYALCLDCLVNTATDVEYLCDRGVIENYLETDEKAAKFFNHLGKGLTFDWDYVDFFLLCSNVNDYCENTCRRHWTSFKGEYFEKPWLWISVLAGFVLLVLTFLQTFYTIYACVHPKN